MKKFKFPMRYVPITATILVFFLVYLIGIISFPNFGSLRVFLDLFTDNAYLGIAAIGTALVILTGGIDLSVGSIIAFTSILIAKIISMKPLVEGHPAYNALFAIALALVIGILFGMLQGWLIYNFSLPPFLVTLAGMFFIRGCGFIVSEESIGIKNDPVFDFIQKDLSVTLDKGLYLRFIVMLYLVVLVIAIVFSQRTRAGRNIYAIGDNELAATLMGIPVGRTKIMTYTIAGFCSALAGLVYAIYLKAGNPLNCVGLEMDAIAAVVIGGTLLTGGVGYVFGSLFGVLVLGLIQTLIIFDGRINSWWTRIIVGLLVLVFIFMQNMITKISKSKSKTH
ncbi:MAG: sugar ABC transporter permease YjfF [Lentisphaeria bacterium]|nr:sugar ABC transporter permease YjfF [Lentisphaeria bacterium]